MATVRITHDTEKSQTHIEFSYFDASGLERWKAMQTALEHIQNAIKEWTEHIQREIERAESDPETLPDTGKLQGE